MRAVDLGRTAAQAELLRFKLLLKRQAMRGVWGAVAVVFGLALLVMVHVVLIQLIAMLIPPVWASVAVLVLDGVLLLVFGLIASGSGPGRTETEAREVRDQALLEMRESLAVSALLHPVGRVAVKAVGRGAFNAIRPGRSAKKRPR